MRTRLLSIDRWNPEADVISQAAEILRGGGLAAFPTETVYGLGANALNADAAGKIYEAKGRPSDNPLILHVSSADDAERLVFTDDRALSLMEEFWPGPLTLVMRARDVIPLRTRGGLSTAAVRMPDHPVALALIAACGFPIAAPSANISGRPSPTDAATVLEDMDGRIDMILDGGAVSVGIESTVLDVSEDTPLLLRAGGLAREAIEDFLHVRVGRPDETSARRSPGTRYRHYAPSVPVVVWRRGEAAPDADGGGFIGLAEPPAGVERALVFNSVENYARGFFSALRELDAAGVKRIIAEWPPEGGLGLGLRDRIARAAGG